MIHFLYKVMLRGDSIECRCLLLDDTRYRAVETLWAGLESRFGLRGIYLCPFPHFSYVVSEKFNADELEELLHDFVSSKKPFTVKTSGLGIFMGKQPVVYIPVVRSPRLTGLQQELWRELFQAGSKIVSHYHPEQWIPHITLGHGDINPDHLPGVVEFLNQQDLHWEIMVGNLSIIEAVGKEQILRRRFNFTG